jgi:[acyl-carrier-protein] S-malonyltransferase
MLNPWLDLEGVGDRLARLGEAAGLDLLAHGTSSDADTIRDTAVAQPLIVGAGLVAAAELLAGSESAAVGATAGHSVGEITAAALAGVLSETEAMSFVGLRGRSMAAASALTPTGMSAVVGGEAEAVLAAIEAAGLTAANVNGAGQVPARCRRWPRGPVTHPPGPG